MNGKNPVIAEHGDSISDGVDAWGSRPGAPLTIYGGGLGGGKSYAVALARSQARYLSTPPASVQRVWIDELLDAPMPEPRLRPMAAAVRRALR